MDQLKLADFLHLSEAEQVPYLGRNAILLAQQFSRADLDEYCRLADFCRLLHKSEAGAALMASLLRHRLALNFFAQPSSRTFLSFCAAESILGMRHMAVQDEKISSMSKGESYPDTIRTFISYVDLIIIRHSESSAGTVAAWVAAHSHRRLTVNGERRPVAVISGGSGTKQHPTQALLDIYTLQKSFEKVGGIDGKKIMLVGDLKRGRTVRSLCYLMKNYRGVSLYFAAPPKYQMEPDIEEFLRAHGIAFQRLDAIAEGIADVDAVYMTRIQDEWDGLAPGTHTPATDAFIFKQAFLARMKPHCCLMHPLPKRDEIEESLDYCQDPRVVYWRQERNGMWMRVALIARLFDVHQRILAAAG